MECAKPHLLISFLCIFMKNASCLIIIDSSTFLIWNITYVKCVSVFLLPEYHSIVQYAYAS